MFRAENTARSDVPGIIRSSTSGGGQAMMVSPMNNSSKLANILTTAVCALCSKLMFKAGASLRLVSCYPMNLFQNNPNFIILYKTKIKDLIIVDL